MKSNTNPKLSTGTNARSDVASIGTAADFGEFDFELSGVRALGIDSGATLVKICAETDAGLHFGTWLSPARDRLGALVNALAPTRLGVTGCGAAELAVELARPSVTPIEFEAWALGADEMLTRLGQPPDGPYLLVSVGTGTSALRVDGDRVERVGGTALGGGTVLGLGTALTGLTSPMDINELALSGAREKIDLMVSDLFADASGIGAMIASCFGKLAREASQSERSEAPAPEAAPADLAAATIGIVADNIALLTVTHARAAGVSRIVYGGSTFKAHPQIANTLRGYAAISGLDAFVLPDSSHAGALGAMLLAAA